MKDNFRCIYIDMPASVKGFVAYNPAEDYYTIYVNADILSGNSTKLLSRVKSYQ